MIDINYDSIGTGEFLNKVKSSNFLFILYQGELRSGFFKESPLKHLNNQKV